MPLLHPDSDLSLSLIFYGADVLGALQSSRTPFTVDALLEKFLRADKRRTPENFFSTLDMLFATGAIVVKSYRVILTPEPKVTLSAPIVSPVIRDLFTDLGDDDA